MSNEVKVIFDGDPRPLFNVTDQVWAHIKATGQQFQNAGATLNLSSNLAAPVKKAASEVEAINRQTAENAKRQARLISEVTRQRVSQELADERRLDRERKRFAGDQIAEMKRIAAEQRKAVSPGPGFGSRLTGAGGLANQALGAFGIGLGISEFLSVADAAIERAVQNERANRLLASSATEAGIAFSIAAEKNKNFAAQLGLSEQQAAATTAKILQLSARAGRPQDADKLLGGFADLGAAFGIDPRDLQNLIGTILSGQDEGLNRLGIADPGALYKAYAQEIGTTADKLTQMQKVQAAVNAVMEKSATFTGAADDRMNSLEGTVVKAAASWDTLKNSMSGAFAQSSIAQDLIKTLSETFGSLAVNIEEVKKKLGEGKTPQEIAKEQFSGPGFSEYLTSFATIQATGGFLPSLLSKTVGQATDPQAIYKRRFDAFVQQITATQTLMDKQNQAAKQSAEDLAKKVENEKKVTEELEKQNDLVKTYSKALSDPKTPLSQLRSMRDSAPTEIADPKKAAEFVDKIDEVIKASIEKGRERVKDLGKTYRTVFDSLTVAANQENPFVKLFVEGENALRSLREQTRGLSEDLRRQFEQMQVQQNSLALFKQRIDTAFTAFDLREEANRFRATPQSDTRVAKEQFDRIVAANIARGQMYQFGGTFGSFLANRAGGADRLSDTQLRDIYETALLGSASPGLNTQSLISALARNRNANPLENLSAQQRLDRQIGLLDQFTPRSAGERSVIDSRIIGLGRGLNPEELRADQRERIAAAMERQAEREERRQQESLDIQREMLAVNQRIAENQERLLGIAETGGDRAVDILIKDETDSGLTVTRNPARPRNSDTQQNYNLDIVGNFGGLTNR